MRGRSTRLSERRVQPRAAGPRSGRTPGPPFCFGWRTFSINTRPEAAELAALDNGTPVGVMNSGTYAAEWIRYYAGWCDKLEQRGPTDQARSRLHPSGTLWSRCGHSPVERFHDGHGPEVRPGARCWQYGGGQAPRTRTVRHVALRRTGARGGTTLRRPQCRSGWCDRRISAGRTCRSGQNQLHRWDRDGTKPDGACGTQFDSTGARTRRQVAEHHLSRCRPDRGRKDGRVRWPCPAVGPGLRSPDTTLRTGKRLRPGGGHGRTSWSPH